MRIGLSEQTPNHEMISRMRRLIDIETHGAVFGWVVGLLTYVALATLLSEVALDPPRLSLDAAHDADGDVCPCDLVSGSSSFGQVLFQISLKQFVLVGFRRVDGQIG